MAPKPQIECPECGYGRVVPIVYGFPGDELMEMTEQRLVTLGGCTISGDDPVWSCQSCQHQWGNAANKQDKELRDKVFAYIDSVFVPRKDTKD